MLIFDFKKSNVDRFYIQMWFGFWKNECGFILGRSDFIFKCDLDFEKMVKNQNFRLLI